MKLYHLVSGTPITSDAAFFTEIIREGASRAELECNQPRQQDIQTSCQQTVLGPDTRSAMFATFCDC